MQGDFSLGCKDNRYKVIKRVEDYINLIPNYKKIDFVIWPESTISVTLNEVKRYIKDKFYKIDNNTTVIMGAYVEKNSYLYNAIIDEDFNILYAKSHLIPFGEYMPKWAESLNSFIPSFRMNNIASYSGKKNIY